MYNISKFISLPILSGIDTNVSHCTICNFVNFVRLPILSGIIESVLQ